MQDLHTASSWENFEMHRGHLENLTTSSCGRIFTLQGEFAGAIPYESKLPAWILETAKIMRSYINDYMLPPDSARIDDLQSPLSLHPTNSGTRYCGLITATTGENRLLVAKLDLVHAPKQVPTTGFENAPLKFSLALNPRYSSKTKMILCNLFDLVATADPAS